MTLKKYRAAVLVCCTVLFLAGCRMQGEVAGTEKDNSKGIDIEEEDGKEVYSFEDKEGRKYQAELMADVPRCTYDFSRLKTDKKTGYMYYDDEENGVTSRTGIDVSEFQGEEIDWKKVKASGVEFAIIRLGYRAYGEDGELVLDDMYEKNAKEAQAAGLEAGVYFLS